MKRCGGNVPADCIFSTPLCMLRFLRCIACRAQFPGPPHDVSLIFPVRPGWDQRYTCTAGMKWWGAKRTPQVQNEADTCYTFHCFAESSPPTVLCTAGASSPHHFVSSMHRDFHCASKKRSGVVHTPTVVHAKLRTEAKDGTGKNAEVMMYRRKVRAK